MASSYAGLSRDQLATLVPELLLIGQMIDRSGMAWCIQKFGREEMLQVAIEEWAAASPIYTKRMQKALKFEGDDVVTIFKGLQLDIGAPPQFMDFRYTVHDRWHGEFRLDYCGALMDVEPLGEDYVRGMCHDIEDPTFDATAVATNPRARVRPIHRPPRVPEDRHPHCAWTVIIDESYPPVAGIPALDVVSRTRAAATRLDEIDADDEGASDYSGPLLSDFDFAAFSHSALVRIADEVCLQMHLLNLSFAIAVRQRAGEDTGLARSICTKQLTGVAGVAAERIHRALSLPGGVDGAMRVIELHPLFNPAAYVDAGVDGDTVHVRRAPAHDDGAWIALCSPDEKRPLQAIAHAVDPHLDVQVSGTGDDWMATVVRTGTAAAQLPEVSVARVSGGATFEFKPRRSLPLTVV
ncbi:hypothetical protein [Mycobacterium sp.]|uniref:hypothetical protein n=1 Tax=Mycobacterium sp. TaxID=1785 RepID=UPI002B7E104D|nr:hypothetical protein [Mycobacterium sp.]HME50044.1 hypothetical protein [Mycobacterium sp.]